MFGLQLRFLENLQGLRVQLAERLVAARREDAGGTAHVGAAAGAALLPRRQRLLRHGRAHATLRTHLRALQLDHLERGGIIWVGREHIG